MSEETFMDGQDLINAAMAIASIEDPDKKADAMQKWDAMYANDCDVMFCIGKKDDGHGKDGIHYDTTGTSFTEGGQIIHTNHDPWTD